jgi:conjugative transposon TraN protein
MTKQTMKQVIRILVVLFGSGLFISRTASAQIAGKDTTTSLTAFSRAGYLPISLKPHPFLLPIARASVRGSYPLEISYAKTTHILFPSKIIDFDAGSEAIMAMVPETVRNVLRVKSDNRGFHEETNMTVFTEDGGLYSFLVRYNEHPEVFTLDIAGNSGSDIQTTDRLGIGQGKFSGFLLPEGRYSEEFLASTSQKVLVQKNFIRHTGARKSDIQAKVRGIFLGSQRVLYLKLELKNRGYLPYQVDFIKLFVKDGNRMKRMAAQQIEVPALAIHPDPIGTVLGYQKKELVLAIPFQTLEDKKKLEVEVYERSGGRHLTITLTNEHLLRARPL